MFSKIRSLFNKLFTRTNTPPSLTDTPVSDEHPTHELDLLKTHGVQRHTGYNRLTLNKLSYVTELTIAINQPSLIELIKTNALLEINKDPRIKQLTNNQCIISLNRTESTEKGNLCIKVLVLPVKLNIVRNASKAFSFKGTPETRFKKEIIMYLYLKETSKVKSVIRKKMGADRTNVENVLRDYDKPSLPLLNDVLQIISYQ